MYLREKFLFIMIAIISATCHAQISRRTAIVEVVENSSPCIVNISTERIVSRRSSFDDIFDEFFDRYQPRVQKTKSLGSGVVVGKEGFIVTNAHVIQRASQITVALSDKTTYTATLLAANEKNDLALLKIDTSRPLKAIEWAVSSEVMIGETAIALGNPFGLESSVTTGVISAKNRPLAIEGKVNFKDFVQTDAAINPGNSGGALLNVHGQLVGINTAIYARGQGLGFAIPADRVRQVLGQLLNYEKLKEQTVGLKLSERGSWSVDVSFVTPGSSAARAGIIEGSRVVSVNGNPVYSIFDFNKAIYLKSIGEKVRVELEVSGKMKTVNLRIARKKKPVIRSVSWKRLGIDVKKVRGRLVITKVRRNGPADRISVVKGDVVVSLGQFRIRSVRDISDFLKYVDYGEVVSIILVRNNNHLGGKLIVE